MTSSHRLLWLASAVGLGLLGLACDLDPKNIGNETVADASGGDDSDCEPGKTRPAEDGCNTCVCEEDGGWACTLLGCDGDGASSTGGAGTCEPGETRPAGDGCNTCVCHEDGSTWSCTGIGCGTTTAGPAVCDPDDEPVTDDGCNTCACTAEGQWVCTPVPCDDTGGPVDCEEGDERPDVDGCNTCTCTEEGWLCTLILCEDDPPPYDGDAVQVCPEDIARDPVDIEAASIEGNTLLLTLGYGGGCEPHYFASCMSGAFQEGDPPSTELFVAHEANDDACEAYATELFEYDLTPLAEAYGETSGTLEIALAGWPDTLLYTW